MTDQLRDALRETANATPPFDLTVDPWVRGRRVRRRRRAGVVGGLVGVGLLIVGLVVGGVPQLSSDPPPPASPTPVTPTLPDRLFDVPRNVSDIRDDPLGGPAAVVYWGGSEIRTGLWSSSADIPLVVGAERDVVRAVRDLRGVSVELSPDGTRLAGHPNSFEDGWPAVLITDLVSGRTERFDLPNAAQGGDIDRLVWTPDGRDLVVRARVILERLGEGSYRGEVRDLVLNSHTGDWSPRAHEAPVAFSPDRRLELRWDGEDPVIAHANGPVQVTLEMRTVDGVRVEPQGSMAFSPDSELVAVWGARPIAAPSGDGNPHSIEIFDVSTGTLRGAVDLGGLGGGGVLGWGNTGLLALIPAWDPGTRLVRFDLSDVSDVSREIVVRQAREPDGLAIWRAAVPYVFLDADVRAAEPPETRFDWVGWIPWLIGAALVVTLMWVRQMRRRERGATSKRPQSDRIPPGDD